MTEPEIEAVARALTAERDRIRALRWDDIPGEDEIGRIMARAAIEALDRAREAAGIVCVPLEPTAKMVRAGHEPTI